MKKAKALDVLAGILLISVVITLISTIFQDCKRDDKLSDICYPQLKVQQFIHKKYWYVICASENGLVVKQGFEQK